MNDCEPLFEDALFRQKRKHGKYRVVESPQLEGPVADTHAHVQMLRDPALALARAGVHGVRFAEVVTDPAEEGSVAFDGMPLWLMGASSIVRGIAGDGGAPASDPAVPHVRFAVGVHPHNAKDYTPEVAAALRERLHDRRVSAIGEIGLDYHYDFSPREVQREVFRSQIRLAHETGLPVVLHVREAHDDAFAILQEESFPPAGTLLHCFNLDTAELARWVEAGSYIAFGGPVTFKKADEVREAAAAVPTDKFLTETDSPYMTPEPLRGNECGPDYVIFTADKLCEVRGAQTPDERTALLAQLYANALGLLDRGPTEWQLEV